MGASRSAWERCSGRFRLIAAAVTAGLAVIGVIVISSAGAATRPRANALAGAGQRAPTCRADQLQIHRHAFLGAILGTSIVSVQYTNVSATACSVDGYPKVRVFYVRHERVPVHFVHGALGPKEPQSATRTVLAAHTGRGNFGLSFLDHPVQGGRYPDVCRRFDYVHAVLPGQGTVKSTSLQEPDEACGGHPYPVVDVSAFGPGGI